jgi:TolB-like protein/Tfp pilus assembly protein PilF
MRKGPESTGDTGAGPVASDRLDSWKDVAAYLRRDVSTVQRWERREGLPIHRHLHDKQGSIYAFRSELDAWQRDRSTRSGSLPSEELPPPGARVDRVDRNEMDRPPKDEPRAGIPVADRAKHRPRFLGAAAIALGLVAVAVVWSLVGSRSGREVTAPVPVASLVVLPLANLSGDPTQDYLAAGLTEELIGALAQLRSLRVVSRTTAATLQGRQIAVPDIARELDVDAVLEGSVRREGERIRISVQLIHGPTDAHLWARDFERDAGSLLALQAEVALAVAAEVRGQATAEERARLASVPSGAPAAYEEYLLGRHLLWKFIEDDRVRAIEHFNRAIESAPDYGAAYAGLAHAWWMRGVFGPLSLREAAGPARTAADMALARDDRLPEAYAAKAYVQGIFDWDWIGAEATIRRGLAIQPNNVEIRYVYALLLMALGRLGESVAQIDQAARLDPLAPTVYSTYGRVLYRARRFDEAERRLTRAIELEPRHYVSFDRLGDVYAATGRFDDAVAAYTRAVEIEGGTTFVHPRIAKTYVRMGRREDARALLPQLRTSAAAPVYAALGDRDRAFDALFRAVEQREDWHIYLKRDPDFDGLTSDPRWRALLARMNLPLE